VKKISVFFVICVVSMVCAGCGYHRARLDNPLLANVKTIAIPYFKNKTFEPGVEKIFTDAFMKEFIESRKLQIVGPNEADVILYGTVRSLKESSIAHDSNDKALEEYLQMVVDLQLEERTTGKVLWKRKGMRHAEDYDIITSNSQEYAAAKHKGMHHNDDSSDTTTDVQASEASKRMALQKIAADLAERTHDSIMMGF
jgi:hypothetical protein